ncbi:hypothetical protein [Nocardioides caldifontis]|uniref:hypothetical protein n=1 Tax=Nocardioides caldifontis TaxID=2588938 RepID=UPI001396B65D|nr:hypothetical protein [Nocardioides caldifontis]
MSLVIAILAGWFVLSLVVALAFGRAARLGSDQTRLPGGPADPAHVPAPAYSPPTAPQQRRHHGPAAA